MARIIKFPKTRGDERGGEFVEEQVWFCDCGCQYFQITETGVYCMECHAKQEPFETDFAGLN